MKFMPEPAVPHYPRRGLPVEEHIVEEALRRIHDREPRVAAVVLSWNEFKNMAVRLGGAIMIEDDDTFVFNTPTGPVRVSFERATVKPVEVDFEQERRDIFKEARLRAFASRGGAL